VKNFSQIREDVGYIKSVILDFEFGKDYQESLSLLKSQGIKAGIATTRILKPSEYYNLNTIIRCCPDLILVRNLGALEYLRSKTDIPLIGDFSLNVSNSLSLDYLIEKGLRSINLSYDLNQQQLIDLIDNSDPSVIEVTLHQYMPEFHMEHCVFAAFLSQGSSFKDCGKPCEKHEVKLKDPYGNMHFLKADHECRNTFFKSTPQSAGFLVNELLQKGVGLFRFEALNEGVEEMNLKIKTYLKLLKNEINLESALKTLKTMETYGLGFGQIDKKDTYQDRKKSTSTYHM
jgi:putative protease